jgi:tetratricopeptide (TPR) repeat protein
VYKKNRNIKYIIAALVFIVSVAGFIIAYKTLTAKEKKIGHTIRTRLGKLEDVQNHIEENIKSFKKIELPVLRYGYSLNENGSYFISEIIKASKKYGIKIDYVKLISVKKNKNTAVYLFKMKGSGETGDIYAFTKILEYNYKIDLKKFYIGKKLNYGDNVSFSSTAAAYTINKQEILTAAGKQNSVLLPPENFGTINPFVNNPIRKKTAAKPKQEPKLKSKPKSETEALIRPKKYKVSENIYKKLSTKTGVKESDSYNKRGAMLFKENNFNEAMDMFKKAIFLNPDNYRALSNAALESYETKNYKKAIFYAKRALTLKKMWQINFILGLAYFHVENYSEAEYNFKKAEELNSSDRQIRYYLNISKNRR